MKVTLMVKTKNCLKMIVSRRANSAFVDFRPLELSHKRRKDTVKYLIDISQVRTSYTTEPSKVHIDCHRQTKSIVQTEKLFMLHIQQSPFRPPTPALFLKHFYHDIYC